MDFLGKKGNEYWFECKHCGERESTLDPERPTTPLERPRKSMLEYGSATTMDKNIYKN